MLLGMLVNSRRVEPNFSIAESQLPRFEFAEVRCGESGIWCHRSWPRLVEELQSTSLVVDAVVLGQILQFSEVVRQSYGGDLLKAVATSEDHRLRSEDVLPFERSSRRAIRHRERSTSSQEDRPFVGVQIYSSNCESLLTVTGLTELSLWLCLFPFITI